MAAAAFARASLFARFLSSITSMRRLRLYPYEKYIARPINNHNGNNNAVLPMLITATTIRVPHKRIPSAGNSGEQGTLNGLGLSGSVFLSIKTPIHTMMKEVNTLKIQRLAARFKSRNKDYFPVECRF